ncbi:AtpZ/AtpI family protein [Pseudodesulfovibrio tunisiensis]|uniref:AtpZ/AtpI family protein n=1 Tax=Pseudodesulfovibrio tunisiensis TaxID=463192 RepID=UPI001FB4993C|nr:AtpZ/AtpI family protein [Pseudodesulfovibrio tunisiensis]
MRFLKDDRIKTVVQVGSTAGTLGLHFVSGTVVGLVIGYYLDKWLGTEPWMTMIWALLGIMAGFKMVFEDVRKLQMREEARKKQQQGSLKQENGEHDA